MNPNDGLHAEDLPVEEPQSEGGSREGAGSFTGKGFSYSRARDEYGKFIGSLLEQAGGVTAEIGHISKALPKPPSLPKVAAPKLPKPPQVAKPKLAAKPISAPLTQRLKPMRPRVTETGVSKADRGDMRAYQYPRSEQHARLRPRRVSKMMPDASAVHVPGPLKRRKAKERNRRLEP